MTDLAQSVYRAKRMSDLAQSVCRIWRKAFVGFGAKRMTDLAQNVFGAKRFWALPRTGCRTTEVVIGAIYTAGIFEHEKMVPQIISGSHSKQQYK